MSILGVGLSGVTVTSIRQKARTFGDLGMSFARKLSWICTRTLLNEDVFGHWENNVHADCFFFFGSASWNSHSRLEP